MADIECPLCDWTHAREADRYAASNTAAAPAVAAAMGLPADALLSIHAQQGEHRDEQAISNHMRTHPPEDWLPELMRMRGVLAQVRELYAAWTAEGLGSVPGLEHTNWTDAWEGIRAALDGGQQEAT